MEPDHIDRLIKDIQQYLRQEDQKKQAEKNTQPPPLPSSIEQKARPAAHLEFMLLISACTTAVLTITILLLGVLSGKSEAVSGTIMLLAAGGCGIFFTAVLISIWKRLVLLNQIEENTRQILASKLEVNVLLERLMHK
jgi:uncharacterized membrane protein YccC